MLDVAIYWGKLQKVLHGQGMSCARPHSTSIQFGNSSMKPAGNVMREEDRSDQDAESGSWRRTRAVQEHFQQELLKKQMIQA